MTTVRIVLVVALLLAGIGSVLLALIAWSQKEERRYFHFYLSLPVFGILIGTLMLLAPGDVGIPLWLVGLALIGTMLINLAWLLAQRFNIPWLVALLVGKRPWALRCSFCNKSQRAVSELIAGPNVYICDACVRICQSVIDEARDPHPEAPEPQPTAP